jgi:hypothetical protein
MVLAACAVIMLLSGSALAVAQPPCKVSVGST